MMGFRLFYFFPAGLYFWFPDISLIDISGIFFSRIAGKIIKPNPKVFFFIDFSLIIVFENVNPSRTWWIFHNIFTKTYRASNSESLVRSKIIEWIKSLNIPELEIHVDKIGNLLIKRKCPNLAKNPTIILQGHMDMVCESDRNDFNFKEQPIPIRFSEDRKWVETEGTTLGADNGIGVSIGLDLITSDDFESFNRDLILLLTISEEAGLDGAFNLDPEFFNITEEKYLINMDSEAYGTIIIGSAGGNSVKITFKNNDNYKIDPNKNILFELSVDGLKGGHSGADIHLPRGNAIKISARVLLSLISSSSEPVDINLVSWNGGKKNNAIPRACSVMFSVKKEDEPAIIERINKEIDNIQDYYRLYEPELKINLKSKPDLKLQGIPIYSVNQSKQIIRSISSIPSGPIVMSPEIPGFVETSNNLGTIYTDIDTLTIGNMPRSSKDNELKYWCNVIAGCGLNAGAIVSVGEGYSGWIPDPQNSLLKLILPFYKMQYAKDIESGIITDPKSQEVKTVAIHAGLECGIIGSKIPGLSCISIGPTIQNLHSPSERVFIPSVESLHNILKTFFQGKQ